MTETLLPTTDEAQAQQYLLFELDEVTTQPTPESPLLPQLSDVTPVSRSRNGKRGQRAAARTLVQPIPAIPTRLGITPVPPPPEIPPLQLAAVRATLLQTLAQQALDAYQELRATASAEALEQACYAANPERLDAAARLLAETPTLKAAVHFLALGIILESKTA
jgi:hypothetical protein